eukprot:jgi/Chrzof1/4797/UNPLg00801.t1
MTYVPDLALKKAMPVIPEEKSEGSDAAPEPTTPPADNTSAKNSDEDGEPQAQLEFTVSPDHTGTAKKYKHKSTGVVKRRRQAAQQPDMTKLIEQLETQLDSLMVEQKQEPSRKRSC